MLFLHVSERKAGLHSDLPQKWAVLAETWRNEFLALLLFTEKENTVAFWGKIFKDFRWDLCGRKSSQRQINITKYSALLQSRWSGKPAASSQGCHFLTRFVWDCLRFLTTLKPNPLDDSSQEQQGAQEQHHLQFVSCDAHCFSWHLRAFPSLALQHCIASTGTLSDCGCPSIRQFL